MIVQGEMDQRMKHLGCPVVQGDKWIVNKWVKWHRHMFSNMYIYNIYNNIYII